MQFSAEGWSKDAHWFLFLFVCFTIVVISQSWPPLTLWSHLHPLRCQQAMTKMTTLRKLLGRKWRWPRCKVKCIHVNVLMWSQELCPVATNSSYLPLKRIYIFSELDQWYSKMISCFPSFVLQFNSVNRLLLRCISKSFHQMLLKTQCSFLSFVRMIQCSTFSSVLYSSNPKQCHF